MESITNGYFDIEAKSIITESKNYMDYGECVSKEDISTTKTMLAFKGEIYK